MNVPYLFGSMIELISDSPAYCNPKNRKLFRIVALNGYDCASYSSYFHDLVVRAVNYDPPSLPGTIA